MKSSATVVLATAVAHVAVRAANDAPDPEENCSLRERKRIVKSAISGLRPRARNVVELIHLQEHSIRETAQILGISTGAVKGRMFHAKITLHRMPLLQSVDR